MTGIVCVLDFKDYLQPSEVRNLTDSMEYRGQKGSDVLVDGPIGLGQVQFRTVRDGEISLPVHSDGIWIAFDGRLDNRLELLSELPYSDSSEDISDVELFLRAYRAWGSNCLSRIVGVFGIALWDEHRERLMCARDKTGVRQLYYSRTDDKVVVASEQRALLNHPSVAPKINEGMLAEYLVDDMISLGETFYTDIKKLEPGTYLSVTDESITVDRYWRPGNLTVRLESLSEGDVVKEFRSIFRKAVSCRLRAEDPAVLMSGGLDSTSVACMASNIESKGSVPTVSAVFDTLDPSDESEYIQTIVDEFNIDPHYVSGDDNWALKEPTVYTHAISEGPCLDQNLQLTRALYECANHRGSDVLLTGYGGNLIDGSRLYYADLLRRYQFITLLQDVLKDQMRLHRILFWYILVPIVPRLASPLANFFGGIDDDVDWPDWLDRSFTTRIDLDNRMVRNSSSMFDDKEDSFYYEQYFFPFTDFALDAERRVALAAGIEPRYPFLDARVIDFIFSLPPRYRCRSGKSKFLFREAMRGILPEPIRTRTSTAIFDPLAHRGFKHRSREIVDSAIENSTLISRGYVNKDAVNAMIDSYLGCHDQKLDEFWRILSAEMWLNWVEDQEYYTKNSP